MARLRSRPWVKHIEKQNDKLPRPLLHNLPKCCTAQKLNEQRLNQNFDSGSVHKQTANHMISQLDHEQDAEGLGWPQPTFWQPA
jgi:hypothetical protein